MDAVRNNPQGSHLLQALPGGRGKVPSILAADGASALQLPGAGGFMSLLAGFDVNDGQDVQAAASDSPDPLADAQQFQGQALTAADLAQSLQHTGLLPQNMPSALVDATAPGRGTGATVDLETATVTPLPEPGTLGVQAALVLPGQGPGRGVQRTQGSMSAAPSASMQARGVPVTPGASPSGTVGMAAAAPETRLRSMDAAASDPTALARTVASMLRVGVEPVPADSQVAQTAVLDAAASENNKSGTYTSPPSVAGVARKGPSRMLGSTTVQALSPGEAGSGTPAGRLNVAGSGDASSQRLADTLLTSALAGGPSSARVLESVRTDSLVAPLDPAAPALAAVVDSAPGARELARGTQAGAASPGGGPAPFEPGGDTLQGVPSGAGAFSAGSPTSGMEETVAEQVAFWVHQNIQKAELTVAHEGQPVEVSVSLSGNEAQVAFRTDQVQTRELLDAGMGELREMLRQEGLELAAVTVGQSGARQGAEEGARQDGQRRSMVQVQAVVPSAGAGRSQGVDVLTDRSVDLFV